MNKQEIIDDKIRDEQRESKPTLNLGNVRQYYIDVLGYSDEDLQGSSFGELVGALNEAQLSDCVRYNNID